VSKNAPSTCDVLLKSLPMPALSENFNEVFEDGSAVLYPGQTVQLEDGSTAYLQPGVGTGNFHCSIQSNLVIRETSVEEMFFVFI